MMYGELNEREQYFHETAWSYLRRAYDMWGQGRKAKAQELLLEARYYMYKVPAEFTEPELQQNMEKIGTLITRGY